MTRFISCLIIAFGLCSQPALADEDPYLWLEDVQSEKALVWAKENNAKTFAELRDNSVYQSLYAEAYDILTSDARIPDGTMFGDHYYNFWQDEVNQRGLLRRTTIKAMAAGAPAWEDVLDVDALEAEEHQNWIFQSLKCVGDASDRCLIQLSRGGKDESVYREFSLQDMTFVDGGFVVPEAKTWVEWLDEDTLLLSTDFGTGLTNSGYPLEIRLWARGDEFGSGDALQRIAIEDTLIAPQVVHDEDASYAFAIRLLPSAFKNEASLIVNGEIQEAMDWPRRNSIIGAIDGQIILAIKEDWKTQQGDFASGDVVAVDVESGATQLVFSPTDKQAVDEVKVVANSVLVQLLDNVVGRVSRIQRVDNEWAAETINLPDNGVAKIIATSGSREDAFVTYESAILPTTLYYISEGDSVTPVAALPHLYDASDVVIEQRFATSTDGTAVPYFVIARKDILEKGDAPTILYGYGGFQVTILPVYYENPSRPQHGALAGRMWISRGGVLAISNIRGGGEFGPRWHQAALLENRQQAFDDYFAIGEHLIETGVAHPDKLGALGRSNGGLLTGVALTQRPDLFAALDIGVPLLDMLRYHQLLAGASWMGEYGNPDIPEQRDYIQKYSPYQNLREGVEYPPVLFYTSTLDDRVHPGHARKMAAKLASLGQSFYYYENMEGGHGGTANQEQLAMRTALEYAYFVRMLMPEVWDAP